MTAQDGMDPEPDEAIAVISLAGRFPGAATIDAFWDNLRHGVESVRVFTEAELAALGVPEGERSSPNYVPAKAVLEDISGFDAGYFGMSPREASLVDPQQRLFLEICTELLERAALGPGQARERVSVFGGISKSTYLFFNLLPHPELRESPAALQTLGATDKDYLATRVSHKLDLRGPSMTVQTACSSSLVAVHLACQSLLSGESDYAIAGGVAVDVPHHAGYIYESGGIFSPDGHCRAFDANARGTVFGQGAGVVLLRRLADAAAAGDNIHAIILGSAVNNDGGDKVGFSAPSVEGQAAVIVEALTNAGVDASAVSYVEAHGTGTALGDPIEVEALTRAFRLWTDRTGFCRLGSVKTNIGHLNAAAGIAGLIKTVLAVEHGEIPPSLNFERPNSRIPFADSPFEVATGLAPWHPEGGRPRLAGVSSFGIGGTNAHVIVASAPASPASATAVPDAAEPATAGGWQLIPLSARTPTALAILARELSQAIEQSDHLDLADVAHTHQTGRRLFRCRTAVVARDSQQAARELRAVPGRRAAGQAASGPSIVFLFPGQGVQYPELARGLYAAEPAFRQELDECGEVLHDLGAADPRELVRAAEPGRGPLLDVQRTEVAQPVLFAIEYALAQLWAHWGIRPDAVAGHSLGELTAACVAGVLGRDDALRLVAERARLMGEAPPGSMLAVACSAADLPAPLPPGVGVAAVNTHRQVVLSGPASQIEDSQRLLAGRGIRCRRISGCYAFHSAAMDGAAGQLASFAVGLELRVPAVPLVSNLTGTWLRKPDALDPGYWGRQLRQPVRFTDCAGTLLGATQRLFLEVGPGQMLCRLVRQHSSWSAGGHRPIASLPAQPGSGSDDQQAMLLALSVLWEAGAEPVWAALHGGARRRPVELPTYPFERSRYWIDPPQASLAAVGQAAGPAPRLEPGSALEPGRPQDPATDIDQRVVAVFEALLGVPDIAGDDDFFELGGHSLLGVELVTRLRDATAVDLPLSTIFDKPTPVSIASLIRAAQRDGLDEALAEAGTGAAADIRLDEGLSAPAVRAGRQPPRTVLLTGATGFLGSFLLHEIVRQTPAVVECLIRCPDQAAGLDRLTRALQRYDLLAGTDLSRVRVVPGDIAVDGLGLGDAEYQRLARTVDAVYHNGAKVSFLEPYRLIRRTNVKAIHEVLRFAAEHSLKPIYHVSTIAVFDCDNLAHVTVADEDEDLTGGGGFHGGYDESKWVAERILGLARQRGFPATVFRPGNIAGHSVTGQVSDGHLVSAMIRGCIALGLAPDADSYVDVVPVDYVSAALVYLSLRESAQGHNFNLVNPARLRWRKIAGQLRDAGYPLELVTLEEWRDAIRMSGAANPMWVFLPMLDERSLFSGRRYRCERTLAELAGSGISCPPLDARLTGIYLRGLVESGELALPPGSAEPGIPPIQRTAGDGW